MKTPPVLTKVRRILTTPQFDALHAALSDPMLQLLVETDLETGLRWGELTELRVKDFDFASAILTVARAVVELNPKFHPEVKRFLVKDYPKDKEWRRFRVADHLTDKIKDHIATHGLEANDLLFEHHQPGKPRRRVPTELPDPATLGWTTPNDQGRRYRHGTPTAYGAGRCRCQHCRNSVAAYRASRRANGKDDPRKPRPVDTHGHIGRDWFRRNVWTRALKAAGIGFPVTPHGLRHAHASWLLAGEPTCRSSRNDLVTPASPRPRGTCTLSPKPRTPPSTPWRAFGRRDHEQKGVGGTGISANPGSRDCAASTVVHQPNRHSRAPAAASRPKQTQSGVGPAA